MRTIKKSDETTTSFIFTNVEPEYQDIVRSLYYMPVEDGFAKSFPADTPHLEKIYHNFERYAPEMVYQAAQIQPVDWEKSLSEFLRIIVGTHINWWLVGSVALAVRGIDVTPHDLDLVVDDASATLLSELLLDTLVEPLQHSQGWIWNSFGRAFLHARFEWVGGVNESADHPEPADFGPAAAQGREMVNWHGSDIWIPPLNLQLAVTERRGLTERAEKIRAFMHTKS